MEISTKKRLVNIGLTAAFLPFLACCNVSTNDKKDASELKLKYEQEISQLKLKYESDIQGIKETHQKEIDALKKNHKNSPESNVKYSTKIKNDNNTKIANFFEHTLLSSIETFSSELKDDAQREKIRNYLFEELCVDLYGHLSSNYPNFDAIEENISDENKKDITAWLHTRFSGSIKKKISPNNIDDEQLKKVIENALEFAIQLSSSEPSLYVDFKHHEQFNPSMHNSKNMGIKITKYQSPGLYDEMKQSYVNAEVDVEIIIKK